MAGQTLAIKIHCFRLEVVMRIVARQTTDARVLRVIAFAALRISPYTSGWSE
jgi:hypothetical protein